MPDAPPSLSCDLLVVGSGAGGLSAAVTAAHLGLHVVVAEKQPRVGGTTAWSGGWMWIPRNPLARAAGIVEDIEAPLCYLRHELGPQFDAARVHALLEHGPRMVDFFSRHTVLRFVDGNAIPDFHGRSPGAASGGRSVCAAAFDGRRLGPWLHRLEPPLRETTLWGLGIASGAEMRDFMNALRRPAAFVRVARLLLRHGRDLAVHRRGTRLVNGNALAAALLRSALDRGVDFRLASPARQLLQRDGRVAGALLDTADGTLEVRARCGVVLACGGFPHDPTRLQALLPHAPTGREHWSAGARGNTGDGLRLGESVGGRVADDLAQAAALAPVSLVPRGDGTTAHFPHLIERAKPGLIAVTARGRRFANEADGYHDVMQALLAATPAGERPEAWLVADHAFVRRYGLGACKPAPLPLAHWRASGYLRCGQTLAALAQDCGIDATALQTTVARYNAMARAGQDEDFAKGQTPYNRVQGDASAGHPNPCMAPLQQAPFYAVKVVMGSLGTFAGLRVDAQARVLGTGAETGVATTVGAAAPTAPAAAPDPGSAEAPIRGLYATGNDACSVMGGHYPSGGITLGPAMTFGYLAAHHAAGVDPEREAAPPSL